MKPEYNVQGVKAGGSALGLYLCGQCLDWLQVEVVVEMQVVQIFTMDKQVEHVVTLSANLQAHLHPVQLGGLKELGGLEGAEQIPERQKRIRFREKTLIGGQKSA